MKTAEILIENKKYLVENKNNSVVSIFELSQTGEPVEIAKGDSLWCACYDWFVNSANKTNIEKFTEELLKHLTEDISDDSLTAMYQVDKFLDSLTGEEFFKLLRINHEQFYVLWKETSYENAIS